MTHNFLVVGLDDRVFNFKAEESVPTTALKGWLAQELVRTRTAPNVFKSMILVVKCGLHILHFPRVKLQAFI